MLVCPEPCMVARPGSDAGLPRTLYGCEAGSDACLPRILYGGEAWV